VDEIHVELGNAIAFQSKNDRMCFPMGTWHTANIDEAVNKRATSAAFSSAGVIAMTADAVPVVPLIVFQNLTATNVNVTNDNSSPSNCQTTGDEMQ